jgi:hypothetical protein
VRLDAAQRAALALAATDQSPATVFGRPAIEPELTAGFGLTRIVIDDELTPGTDPAVGARHAAFAHGNALIIRPVIAKAIVRTVDAGLTIAPRNQRARNEQATRGQKEDRFVHAGWVSWVSLETV